MRSVVQIHLPPLEIGDLTGTIKGIVKVKCLALDEKGRSNKMSSFRTTEHKQWQDTVEQTARPACVKPTQGNRIDMGNPAVQPL